MKKIPTELIFRFLELEDCEQTDEVGNGGPVMKSVVSERITDESMLLT